MIERHGYKMIDYRQLYLDYLNAPAPFIDRHSRENDGNRVRSRVRYPQQYETIVATAPEDCIDLHEVLARDCNVWVWSDQHFGHKNIIKYSNRPFDNLDQMRETMIMRHNEVVEHDDVCIWVGDVAFLPDQQANAILSRLNGYHILIVGNHDMHKKKVKNLDVDEIHLYYCLDIADVTLLFTHFPLDNLPHPIVNVHGHVHDQDDPSVQHINVSVERIDYRPVNLTNIVSTAQSRVLEMAG